MQCGLPDKFSYFESEKVGTGECIGIAVAFSVVVGGFVGAGGNVNLGCSHQ